MTRSGLILIAALTGGLPAGTDVDSTARPARPDSASVDSTARAFRIAMRKLTTPELEQRNRVRRAYQQRGYATTLSTVIRQDALSALMAYLRTRGQIDFHLPHNPLVINVPIVQPPPLQSRLPGFTGGPSPPISIPLFEDWTFPPDPWK